MEILMIQVMKIVTDWEEIISGSDNQLWGGFQCQELQGSNRVTPETAVSLTISYAIVYTKPTGIHSCCFKVMLVLFQI